MPIATEQEPLYCAGCGDEVAMVNRQTQNGPCCHNLPNPWHRGSDGLYNSTTEVPDEDEDEEPDERLNAPHCPNCGSTVWIVSATQRVDASDDEETNGVTIYFDDREWDDYSARCADCDRQMSTSRYELESS